MCARSTTIVLCTAMYFGTSSPSQPASQPLSFFRQHPWGSTPVSAKRKAELSPTTNIWTVSTSRQQVRAEVTTWGFETKPRLCCAWQASGSRRLSRWLLDPGWVPLLTRQNAHHNWLCSFICVGSAGVDRQPSLDQAAGRAGLAAVCWWN